MKPATIALKAIIATIFDKNIHSIEDAKKFARPIEEWSPEEIRGVLESMGISDKKDPSKTCHSCWKYGYPECPYFPEEPPVESCIVWSDTQ